jgi:hypothetical protein
LLREKIALLLFVEGWQYFIPFFKRLREFVVQLVVVSFERELHHHFEFIIRGDVVAAPDSG